MTERLVEENVMPTDIITHPESADSRMQHESPDHPYTLVDMYNFHAILRAQNGTEFGVSQAVGRTILALAVGAEHGKTRQEISKDVYAESPERVVSHVYIRELIRKARIATIGLG